MFALDRRSGDPLSVQIKNGVTDRIRSGLLTPGEQLPTVRQMAARLSVSPVTVIQAYAALEASGLVTRVHGRGVFVRPRPGDPLPPAGAGAWQRSLSDYIPRSLSGYLLRSDLPSHVVPMHVAAVEASLLQVMELANAVRNAALSDPGRLGWYSPPAGIPELRAAVAAYLTDTGLKAAPGDVLITQGAQQGIDLIARTFVGPGDGVAIETPSYPPTTDAFRARNVRLHPIPVDDQGMRVDLLEEIPHLRLVCVVPTFQNPTGTVLSRRRREQLLEIARRRNLLILEDDPWSEFAYDTAPPPTLKSQDTGGHVLYVKSFSKLLSVGVRIGAVVASGQLLQRLVAAKEISDLGVSLLPQLAVLPVLQDPRLGRRLKRMVAALRERRDAVLRTLASTAPDGTSWSAPAGGLNVWVRLPRHLDAEALLPRAEAEGVTFAPGVSFFPAAPEGNHLRLSFGAGKPPDLERGVTALCRAIAQA